MLETSAAKAGGLKIVRMNSAARECRECLKRLAVLPTRIRVHTDLDESMPLQQWMTLLPPITTNLCEAAASALASHGYRLTSKPIPLLIQEDWRQFDPDTARALVDLDDEYRKLLGKIYEQRDTPEGKQLTGYRIGTRLNDLVPTLVSPDAQTVLFMDSKIVLESPKGKTTRVWTEDIYYMLATGGPTRVVHHAALVNARTREVLWWASKIYHRTDARNQQAVAATVEDFFSDMPPAR